VPVRVLKRFDRALDQPAFLLIDGVDHVNRADCTPTSVSLARGADGAPHELVRRAALVESELEFAEASAVGGELARKKDVLSGSVLCADLRPCGVDRGGHETTERAEEVGERKKSMEADSVQEPLTLGEVAHE
jgi:hypothetical protein